MNMYQKEQLESYRVIEKYLSNSSEAKIADLQGLISEYIEFRNQVESFQNTYFNLICIEKCFKSDLSACCSKDGIIIFFADLAINAIVTGIDKTVEMVEFLNIPHQGEKCIYLGPKGCQLLVRPIVCQMFLCEMAEKKVFDENQAAFETWKMFEQRKKDFTWPDKTVLFDQLEEIFIDQGYQTGLMHCHNSPGLLRIKSQARKI